MGYTIEIPGGIRAAVQNRRWTSDHKLWEQNLNLDVPAHPSGGDPDPDYTLALQAARRWHGQVITPPPEPTPPEPTPPEPTPPDPTEDPGNSGEPGDQDYPGIDG
jgi:hypothetical protein